MEHLPIIDSTPKGWMRMKLGELITVSSGKGLKLSSLQGGNYPVYGGNGVNGYHSEYFIEEPKLIIGRVGVKCGVTHITRPKSWVTDNALIVEPKCEIVDIRFLKLKLEFENLNKLSVSTAQPVISGSKIYAYEVLLPPKQVQEAIVSKIEELFSELDKGVEQLKIAQQQLKTYRQAVLKWAFEGRFTNENVKEGELPEGWKWVNSGSLFDFVTSGSRGWAKYYSNKGAIFLRITNMDFDTLNLDLSEKKVQYVSPPNNAEGIRTKVQEGDFLFSITGYLGMFAIAPKLENAFVNQHIALCRPNPNVNSRFVGYWIVSKTGGLRQLNMMNKGATKSGLGLDDIKNFLVPMPPSYEQDKIIEEIEARLSGADNIGKSISRNLQQAELLKQSILKMAFEGRLIASVSIEAIKEQL